MIGNRVVAWRGPNKGLHGKVVRVDGTTHCFVLWDDGTECHESNANLCWETFSLKAKKKLSRP